MKKKLIVFVPLIVIGILFVINSCEKGESVFNTNKLGIRQGGHLTGKLYRAIAIRPRDGKPCGCAACFGICNVKWVEDSTESYNIDIVFNVAPGKARIYFPIALSNAENEFGIDSDLVLPSSIVPANYSNGKLKCGLYSYNFNDVNYTYNGETKISYGYVDVDFALW